MILRTRLPKRVVSELKSWSEVYLSDGNSYYDRPHSMIMSVGSRRISNHWNLGNGTFRTNKSVINGNWVYARYNGSVWVVEFSLSPRKNAITINNDELRLVEVTNETNN
jgi:hypothetical protein